MILNNLIAFLLNRSWVISEETDNFLLLSPPEEMIFPEGFHLYIPRSIDRIDGPVFLKNLYNSLTDIYGLNKDDIKSLIEDNNSVLKIRLFDDEVLDGKINLERFESLIEKTTLILTEAASFVITKELVSNKTPREVKKYLHKCTFMQTEVGSFVAKFQLPETEILLPQDAFREELYSKEVNNKLSEVLSFINNIILNGDDEVDDEYILENPYLFNLKLYKNIYDLLFNSALNKIDISLHSSYSSRYIYNDSLSKVKLYRLEQVVERIKHIANEIGDFRLRGRILSLKSKDPDGISNVISMGCAYDGLPFTVTLIVDSERYKEAINAHRLKQNIEIFGRGRKQKESIKIMELFSFQIEE